MLSTMTSLKGRLVSTKQHQQLVEGPALQLGEKCPGASGVGPARRPFGSEQPVGACSPKIILPVHPI
jgi:hypothetical protein